MYNREKIIKTLRDIVKEADTIEPYVVIAQPRRDKKETPAQTFNAYGLCHVDFMNFSMGFVDIDGEKVDVARNYLFDRVLETKAKYLLFIGEDTVLPFNGFKKLHETAEKNPDAMIAGVYYVKCGGPMINIKDGVHIREANVDPGQVFEIWQGGLDCILIPTSIIRTLYDADPDLPYCCIANQIEDIPFIGEDNFFYYRVRNAGFKILCDTDVQCLHIDLSTGKYTAHPSIDPANYFTNIPITTSLTIADKIFINRRWEARLPIGTGNHDWIAGYSIPKLIQHVENPVGVEIGTAEGFTTEYLIRNVPNLTLFGIDPYVGYMDWDDEYRHRDIEKDMFFHKLNAAMEAKRYTHLLMTSDEAIKHFKDNSLDFVFIDGLHTYDQVQKDCQNYYSKLKSGGIFCGHDYNRIEDVRKSVQEFAKSVDKEIQVAERDLWYFVK